MNANEIVWSRNIRIIAFVLVMLFVECWKWSFRMSIQADQKNKILAAARYVECFITQSGKHTHKHTHTPHIYMHLRKQNACA